MKPFSLSSMVTMMVFTALLLTSGQAVAWFGQSTPVREVEPCAGKLNALSGTTEAAFRIRGYGEGENFQQAKVEALRDIAERIQVRVTGRSVSSTHMARTPARLFCRPPHWKPPCASTVLCRFARTIQ